MPEVSVLKKTPVLPLVDQTSKALDQLRLVPTARKNEGLELPAQITSRDVTKKLVPQEGGAPLFDGVYVRDEILNAARTELAIFGDNLFPNYHGFVVQFDWAGKSQLLLVATSTELEIAADNAFPRSLPFLLYIPPSPQDTRKDHRKKYPTLYRDTKDEDIPVNYEPRSEFPWGWDWLFFQALRNLYKFSYQLKSAEKPFVLVVPFVKSGSDGIGALENIKVLERCLLGVQKFVFDSIFPSNFNYFLPEIEWISIATFSQGNVTLHRFLSDQNRIEPLFKYKVRQFIIFDPPPRSPDPNSPEPPEISPTLCSVLRSPALVAKDVFVYAQDYYYLEPFENFIRSKGVPINLRRDRIFSDVRAPNIFLAFLDKNMFPDKIRDFFFRDTHNTIPNLFLRHAISMNKLSFGTFNLQKFPKYPTP